MFKVEFRKTCKVCDKPVPKGARSYCSKQCRNKFFNKKNAHLGVLWQRKRRDLEASKPSPNKVKCLICGKYYVQVCSHIYQVHGCTAREYREDYDLEVKRGVVPDWFRKLKGEKAMSNGTYKNLEVGKKFWFTKGDHSLGRYKRSKITLERLKHLYKFRTIKK
jgi:predicted nucleic acid-binding Zn ribbon protein